VVGYSRPLRLLRFARNDRAEGRCEERSDETIPRAENVIEFMPDSTEPNPGGDRPQTKKARHDRTPHARVTGRSIRYAIIS
jgi:hypothetical protein